MPRPPSRRGDLAAGTTLAIGLHLAAALLLGGRRSDDTPPTLAQPRTMRVAIQLNPATPRPTVVAQTLAPRPRSVTVPRASLALPHLEHGVTSATPPSLASVPKRIALTQTPFVSMRPEIERVEMPVGTVSLPELVHTQAQSDHEDYDGDVDYAPKPRRTIRPVYPYGARQRGESGSVVALINVSAQGRVEQVTIARSSGYEALDQAAREALLAARFTPARRGTTSVPARVRLTIIFQLKG